MMSDPEALSEDGTNCVTSLSMNAMFPPKLTVQSLFCKTSHFNSSSRPLFVISPILLKIDPSGSPPKEGSGAFNNKSEVVLS